LRSDLPTLLLQIFGFSLIGVTVLAANAYAWFMVLWMHAPPLKVIGFTVVLSVPVLLVAWGTLSLARRLKTAHG
jgi:hypothetical protein